MGCGSSQEQSKKKRKQQYLKYTQQIQNKQDNRQLPVFQKLQSKAMISPINKPKQNDHEIQRKNEQIQEAPMNRKLDNVKNDQLLRSSQAEWDPTQNKQYLNLPDQHINIEQSPIRIHLSDQRQDEQNSIRPLALQSKIYNEESKRDSLKYQIKTIHQRSNQESKVINQINTFENSPQGNQVISKTIKIRSDVLKDNPSYDITSHQFASEKLNRYELIQAEEEKQICSNQMAAFSVQVKVIQMIQA